MQHAVAVEQPPASGCFIPEQLVNTTPLAGYGAFVLITHVDHLVHAIAHLVLLVQLQRVGLDTNLIRYERDLTGTPAHCGLSATPRRPCRRISGIGYPWEGPTNMHTVTSAGPQAILNRPTTAAVQHREPSQT